MMNLKTTHGLLIELWPTGQITCFRDGVQVGELQVPVPVLLAAHARAEGYDPHGMVIRLMPGGRRARIFATGDEECPYNYELV